MDPEVNVSRWICSESKQGSELRHSTSQWDEES
jgi:hypothetical protein